MNEKARKFHKTHVDGIVSSADEYQLREIKYDGERYVACFGTSPIIAQ